MPHTTERPSDLFPAVLQPQSVLLNPIDAAPPTAAPLLETSE